MSKDGPKKVEREPTQAELEERIKELDAKLIEHETKWANMGDMVPKVEFGAEYCEFVLKAKMALVTELLCKLTGMTEIDMDIRLKEIMLDQFENMTPAMEEASREAAAARILKGIHNGPLS